MKTSVWLLLVVLCLLRAQGQELGYLSVHSESDTLAVYRDTVCLGETPLDSIPLIPGNYILRYTGKLDRKWYQPPVVETVKVASGEHLQRKVALPGYTYSPRFLTNTSFFQVHSDSAPALPTNALAGKVVFNDTPLYLTTAGAVLSGAVAAYLKIQADNYYEDYRRTGDQSALDKVKRNDTISGIALVACEVNLVALTYLLLMR